MIMIIVIVIVIVIDDFQFNKFIKQNSKNGNFGWKEKRRLRKEAKKATEEYRKTCKELDEDYLKLRAEHLNYKENNPLIPFAKLILGILSIIASIVWLLQLGLYVFPIQFTGKSYAPFMNTMFIKLNRFFPMIASALVGDDDDD